MLVREAVNGDGDVIKIKSFVEFEQRRNFLVHDANPQKDPQMVMMELVAVVCHFGASVQTGHCVAYTRHGDEWLECNDTGVEVSSWAEVAKLGEEAYILLFDGTSQRSGTVNTCV